MCFREKHVTYEPNDLERRWLEINEFMMSRERGSHITEIPISAKPIEDEQPKILLVGNPGCGASQYYNQMMQASLEAAGIGVQVINQEDIYMAPYEESYDAFGGTGHWIDPWSVDWSGRLRTIESVCYIESPKLEIEDTRHENQIKAETLAKLVGSAKIQARQATKGCPGKMNNTRLRSMERHNMQSTRHQHSNRRR